MGRCFGISAAGFSAAANAATWAALLAPTAAHSSSAHRSHRIAKGRGGGAGRIQQPVEHGMPAAEPFQRLDGRQIVQIERFGYDGLIEGQHRDTMSVTDGVGSRGPEMN